MNNRYSKHASDEQLLRALDGELSARDLSAVQEHIEACWSYRARREQMERAISRLVAWRNEELGSYPPPPTGGRQRLARALGEQTTQRENASLWRSFLSFAPFLGSQHGRHAAAPGWSRAAQVLITALERNRAQYLSGAIAIVMVVLLVLSPVVNPPVVTAAVFLERVRLSRIEETSHGRKAIHQRLEIRSGKRVLQREIVLANDQREHSAPGQEASWIPFSLANSPVSWSDPLGVDAFRQWRDSLVYKNNNIHEANQSLTLFTKPTEDSRIVAASLTMRSSDWHPIAKRVEFRDQPPLEVRELAYEVREMPTPTPSLANSPELGTKPTLEPRSAMPVPGPTDQQLDESEVRLREALHSLGADRTDVYQIRRENSGLDFQSFSQSAEQHNQLVAALRDIPYVNVQSVSPETASERTAHFPDSASIPPTAFTTQPPLAKQLWEYSGGMDQADNYMAMVRDAHRGAFSAASALSRLGERYPVAEWDRLSPDLQDRIARIAADNAVELKSASAGYLKVLSPVLDVMLHRENIAPTTPVEPSANRLRNARCEPWQPVAGDISADLLRLQDSFRRLFIEDQTDRPLTLTVDGLLREAVGAKDFLQHDLSRLCAPDQARR
ncbi:MAG: hypothetical protein DMG57_11575 [Acidobacteria bacterium]|nr:MAG: hypothetical protein DMG57_11575 [Acidobacteriota bacterium]